MMPTKDDAPERIWVETYPYDFPGYSPCFVWHHPESMEDGTDGCTEYVRADMLAALQADVERLTGERDQWIAHAKAAIWTDSEECKVLTQAVAEVRAELDQMTGIANDWRESAEASASDYHRALELNGYLMERADRLLARAEAAEAAGRENGIREAADWLAAEAESAGGVGFPDIERELLRQSGFIRALTQPQEARDDMQDM